MSSCDDEMGYREASSLLALKEKELISMVVKEAETWEVMKKMMMKMMTMTWMIVMMMMKRTSHNDRLHRLYLFAC